MSQSQDLDPQPTKPSGAPNTFKVLQFVVFRICLPLKLHNCMKLSLEDSAMWLVPDCNWGMAELEKRLHAYYFRACFDGHEILNMAVTLRQVI